MDAINDEVTGEEHNAPRLTTKAFDSYDFETPKDKGTDKGAGTNHRSMIIYDLAMLQNTVFPALAHDSIVFDSKPRPDLSNLIRVYADQVEKQIFIAVDKTSECTPEAQSILQETTVLKLDNTRRRSLERSRAGRNVCEDPIQQALKTTHRQEHEQNPAPR